MPRKIQFGLFQPQVGLSFSILKERALAAEEYGFHSIWLPDHMWVRGMPQLDYLESWTVLSGLAGATTRIRLGGLVFCNSYRNPAFLLKQAITVDHISGGRVDFGVGAGWVEREHEAYGWHFPNARERVERFAEALEIWDLLQTRERTTYDGHY